MQIKFSIVRCCSKTKTKGIFFSTVAVPSDQTWESIIKIALVSGTLYFNFVSNEFKLRKSEKGLEITSKYTHYTNFSWFLSGLCTFSWLCIFWEYVLFYQIAMDFGEATYTKITW